MGGRQRAGRRVLERVASMRRRWRPDRRQTDRLEETIQMGVAADGGDHQKWRRDGRKCAAARLGFGRRVREIWPFFGDSENTGGENQKCSLRLYLGVFQILGFR